VGEPHQVAELVLHDEPERPPATARVPDAAVDHHRAGDVLIVEPLGAALGMRERQGPLRRSERPEHAVGHDGDQHRAVHGPERIHEEPARQDLARRHVGEAVRLERDAGCRARLVDRRADRIAGTVRTHLILDLVLDRLAGVPADRDPLAVDVRHAEERIRAVRPGRHLSRRR
jgi:hypothetical protein